RTAPGDDRVDRRQEVEQVEVERACNRIERQHARVAVAKFDLGDEPLGYGGPLRQHLARHSLHGARAADHTADLAQKPRVLRPYRLWPRGSWRAVADVWRGAVGHGTYTWSFRERAKRGARNP